MGDMVDMGVLIENNFSVVILVILLGAILGISLIKKRSLSILTFIVVTAISFAISAYLGIGSLSWVIGLEIPIVLVGLGIYLVAQNKQIMDVTKPFRVVLLAVGGKKKYIENINRGVAIFGASGAGKSESVIYQMLKHFSQYKFAGIINDYKNFELTEIAYPLYQDTGVIFRVFAIHDVTRSIRINPIDPKYLQSESDVNGLVKVLMLNLGGEVSDDTAMFFRGGAESLMAGIIWRLKESYPQYCTLPHLIAILLNYENLHEPKRPFGKLVRFLQVDIRAKMLASTFLTGLGSEKQTASLCATLAESLRSLVSAEVFFLLSGNDIDLAVNAEETRQVISFVNHPGPKESIISALNATIIATCFARMSERGRKESFVLLDEAPTVKIAGLGRRVATLRSYGVSFIYCVQDKIQGVSQWGGKEYHIKEILTNLSTQFFGKVNDPDTAQFYEKYFEIIKKEQHSYSKRNSLLGKDDKRTTTSKKDEVKIRGFEFFKLKEGEFVMFNEGIDKLFRFHYEVPKKTMPPVVRMVTSTELQRHYLAILQDSANLFNQ